MAWRPFQCSVIPSSCNRYPISRSWNPSKSPLSQRRDGLSLCAKMALCDVASLSSSLACRLVAQGGAAYQWYISVPVDFSCFHQVMAGKEDWLHLRDSIVVPPRLESRWFLWDEHLEHWCLLVSF